MLDGYICRPVHICGVTGFYSSYLYLGAPRRLSVSQIYWLTQVSDTLHDAAGDKREEGERS